MPEVFDLEPILVTGPTNNSMMLMWQLMELSQSGTSPNTMVTPAQGTVAGHVISVEWEGTSTTKPDVVNGQIRELRNAFIRVGAVIAALSDWATYQFGPVQLTGAELKAAYFALTTITLTDDIYRPGYGGENLGDTLRIGVKTAQGWGLHGLGAYNFLMLHEMVHNSVPGRALAQQMWDRHRLANGTWGTFKEGSSYFEQQEAMTNTIARQIGVQIGVNVNSSTPNAPGCPTFGYYSGPELTPQP